MQINKAILFMLCLLTVSASDTFLLYKIRTLVEVDSRSDNLFFGVCGVVQSHDVSQQFGDNPLIDKFNGLIENNSAVILGEQGEAVYQSGLSYATTNYQIYIWANQDSQPYNESPVKILHNGNEIGEYDIINILYFLVKREGSALDMGIVTKALHENGKLIFNDQAAFPDGSISMAMGGFKCPDIYDNTRRAII